MNNILNEEIYDEVELFAKKNDDKVKELLRENVKLKSQLFVDSLGKYDFETCFHEICEKMDIDISKSKKGFIYFFDFDFQMYLTITNITPAYDIIMENGIKDIGISEAKSIFEDRYNSVLDSLAIIIKRIADALDDDREKNIFLSMLDKPAYTFYDAVQRILFLNQMIWQAGATIVGLGRLDMLLWPYYQYSIDNGIIEKEEAYEIINDFLSILHKHYWYKSRVMLGDTGQVIVLGGSDKNGNYLYNDLTEMFLDAVTRLNQAEPKLVLRVNNKVPREIMEKALVCMKTGKGSPLLANDEVIIPKLIEYGIEVEDAYNYSTSACWEPLIGGMSSSNNNRASFSYIRALDILLFQDNLISITSFENLLDRYDTYLKQECIMNMKRIYNAKEERNTLYSIFIHGCKESLKDISEGGAKYHNRGMTTVGLGNAINSLMLINEYVFEKNKISLTDVKRCILDNFNGYEDLLDMIKQHHSYYGTDDENVIALTKRLTKTVSKYTMGFLSKNGDRLKFGISGNQYVIDGARARASFDGRKNGEPFIVHISNENASSYTEVINFASAMDYGDNRFNGNVVDLMINPGFIENHFDKMVDMFIAGIKIGFFELQTNVISSDVLIAAKKNPDKYKSLIVRVWGFSAYFVELSEDYQNVLIERALKNEGKIAG